VDVLDLKARAREAVVKGRLEQAEVLYRQVLTRRPRDAAAWLRHAEVLRRLARAGDAVWSYRTAATILLALGHEAQAIAGLKLALELQPDDVDLVTEIIRVELHRHHRRAAAGSAPTPLPTEHTPLDQLEEAQLALPMLGAVDLNAVAGSAVTAAVGVAAAGPSQVSAPVAEVNSAPVAEAQPERQWRPTPPGIAPVSLTEVSRQADGAPGERAWADPGVLAQWVRASSPGAPGPVAPTASAPPTAGASRAAPGAPPAYASSPSSALGEAPEPARSSSPPGLVRLKRAGAPARSPEPVRATPAPASQWPQLRRLNDREVAIKTSADSPWILITSQAPLDVRFAQTLAIDEESPWVE
jgi:hypothetical protein